MAVIAGTFLSLLDEPERDALRGLGVVRRFPRGSMLMFQGEPGERVMVVLSGRVKVSQTDPEGREVILSIRDPGDILGELAFIDGQPRVATVSALEPVTALAISSTAFREHLERSPRVAVALLEVVTRRFRETTTKRAQFSALDTIGRLAARILELGDRYGSPAGDCVVVSLPLTREELAQWTGASRAGLAHAIQTLRELGWIAVEGRRIFVRDRQALRSRAS